MGLGDDAHSGWPAQALLFEEFLAREARGRPLEPAAAAGRRSRCCVHGHCHQKAFGAMPPVLEVLRLIPGAEVRA